MPTTGYCHVWLGPERTPAREVLGHDVQKASLKLERKKPGELSLSWMGLPPDIMDDNRVAEEALVSFEFGYDGGSSISDTYIIKALQPEWGLDVSLTITAHDKQVRLVEAIDNKVYVQSRASDVARDAARLLGLQAEVEESNVVYDYIPMAGQTYGQVLRGLAENEDFEFWVRKDVLYFGPVRVKDGADYRLYYHAMAPNGLYLINMKGSADAVIKTAGGSRTTTGGKDREGEKVEEAEVTDILGLKPKEQEAAYTATTGGRDYRREDRLKSREATPELAEDGSGDTQAQAKAKTKATNEKARARYGAIDIVPSDNPDMVRRRNAALARMLRWKGQKASLKLYGGFPQPRDKFVVEGIGRVWRGPWMVNRLSASLDDGDVACDVEAIWAPPEKPGGGKPDPDDGTKPKDEEEEGGEPGQASGPPQTSYTATAGGRDYRKD